LPQNDAADPQSVAGDPSELRPDHPPEGKKKVAVRATEDLKMLV
jgi:hypothetical protein